MALSKGKVEGGVLIVERWILARLRNRQFFSIPSRAMRSSDCRLRGWCCPYLSKAVRYALICMPKAHGYLDDGQLELDKNTCQRSIRPMALGRKNFLFMDQAAAGRRLASPTRLLSGER